MTHLSRKAWAVAILTMKALPRNARELLVQAGVLTGYLLSMYTARKLKMQPAGQRQRLAQSAHQQWQNQKKPMTATMLKKLGTGLLVTELLGSGVNYVTGDYSRGASGFWVENGVIVHPVQEITIAGNLKDMFQQSLRLARMKSCAVPNGPVRFCWRI